MVSGERVQFWLGLDKIKWYSEEDEMSDIFYKIFIRLAERKYVDSDKSEEELTAYCADHGFKKILEDINQYLLQDDLTKEYFGELKENALDSSLATQDPDPYELIYTLLGLEK